MTELIPYPSLLSVRLKFLGEVVSGTNLEAEVTPPWTDATELTGRFSLVPSSGEGRTARLGWHVAAVSCWGRALSVSVGYYWGVQNVHYYTSKQQSFATTELQRAILNFIFTLNSFRLIS